MSEQLERIWVHPALKEELRLLKETIETKSGAKINGGIPQASFTASEILKRKREGKGYGIKIELQRIRGTKKNEVIYL